MYVLLHGSLLYTDRLLGKLLGSVSNAKKWRQIGRQKETAFTQAKAQY